MWTLILFVFNIVYINGQEEARQPLDELVHLSYLRLKTAPSILWHQIQAKSQINDENMELSETDELCRMAHRDYNICPTKTQAFFKSQNEGNLLIRYAYLGLNLSAIAEQIFYNKEHLNLRLDIINKAMLVNLSSVEDALIGGNCRQEISSAIDKQCKANQLNQLYETALTRSLGYLIDVCQLHNSWFTGSPEFKNIII